MADDETNPKRKAKDNPWYRLATLHGEPSSYDDELAGKNRMTWNRWMATDINVTQKEGLIQAGRCQVHDLSPFSEDERQRIQSATGVPAAPVSRTIQSSRRPMGAIRAEIPGGFGFENAEFALGVYFRGFIFPTAIHWSAATFTGPIDLTGATFLYNAYFTNAVFSDVAFFDSAHFGPLTVFDGATFHKRAGFGRARFQTSSFRKVTFSFPSMADFEHAQFRGDVGFWESHFEAVTLFNQANFSQNAMFDEATFSGRPQFQGTRFLHVGFGSAIFAKGANFAKGSFAGTPNFVNAEMKGETSFDKAAFSEPPRCFNAILHEGTTWHDVGWPKTPQDRDQAQRFCDAYERLKFEMDRLKKHGDELDFFAREQQCRGVLDGHWKGFPIAIYGFLSDYGRSFIRPLLLLAATVLIGTFLFAAQLVGFWTPLISDPVHTGQAIGLSFANTFGVLSIRKDFINPQVLQQLPSWLMVVSTIQSIVGIVLLFLLGLGIRNRFRMK